MDVTLPKSEAEMLNGAREWESLAGLATGQSLASGAGGRRTAACIVSAGTPKPWGAPPSVERGSHSSPALPWASWRSQASGKTALRLPEKWEEMQLFVKSLKNVKT